MSAKKNNRSKKIKRVKQHLQTLCNASLLHSEGISQALKIQGQDDCEITYDEVVRMAFDPNTPERHALQYQTLLQGLKVMVDEQSFQWGMITFVLKPGTNEIRAWY